MKTCLWVLSYSRNESEMKCDNGSETLVCVNGNENMIRISGHKTSIRVTCCEMSVREVKISCSTYFGYRTPE